MTYDEIRAQLAGACEARWPDAMSNDETVISLLPTVRAIATAAEARGRAEERNRWIAALGMLAGRHDLRGGVVSRGHVHEWTDWFMPIWYRDWRGHLVGDVGLARLGGTDEPVTSDWVRVCRTCDTEQRS